MKTTNTFRDCIDCGTTFGVFHKLQTRCKPCRTYWRNRKLKKYTKPCNRCGVDFHPRDTRAKTCPACKIAYPCKICGTLTPRKGTANLYCSLRCADRAKLVAKHGHRNHLEALKRDGFKCVKCGDDKAPHVHHIDGVGLGYDRKNRNNALDNLISLCNSCHGTIHGLTARTLYAKHPETVREVLELFLAG